MSSQAELTEDTVVEQEVLTEPSQSRGLYEALFEAKKRFLPVVKTELAKVKHKSGGQHSYSYADLAGVLEAIDDALEQCRIYLEQVPMIEGNRVSMVTTLVHLDSGQSRSYRGVVLNAGGDSPQVIGSAITYARRYQLMSVLGIAPIDDDGAAAESAHRRNQPADDRRPVQSNRPANSQPKQSQPASEQLRSALVAIGKAAGVEKLPKEQALQILKWASLDGVESLEQAFGNENACGAILTRLQGLKKEHEVKDMLRLATDYAIAEEAF